jgi:tetratricopeptide (TPR) repeat protein
MSVMRRARDTDVDPAPATDGAIAVGNLSSARARSWNRFWNAPLRPGAAEAIIEQEHLTAQFLGDLNAFDRVQCLVREMVRVEPDSACTALIQAQVEAMTHGFAEARSHLAQATVRGAPPGAAQRLLLSIDQACGHDLDRVLEIRRRVAMESGQLEDLVPLGALLADLGDFDEADFTYQRALRGYEDVSPFAVAWVCFQLGVLWGELAPRAQITRAARWYEIAIRYLPDYVKARVHLSEVYAAQGRVQEAEALLVPALASGDPEVNWRLADLLNSSGQRVDGDAQLQRAHSGFESLLERHPLAFADHGAEFYHGSGDDPRKALELAQLNLANRPTLRAFEQAYAIAVDAGTPQVAAEVLAAGRQRWGATAAFRDSTLDVSL